MNKEHIFFYLYMTVNPSCKMKHRSVILLLLFLQVFQSTGQIAEEIQRINADSLHRILPELEGTEKIDALNKIAFKLCYKYPDSCISIANQTIKLSESINYIKGEATGYFNLGNGYFFLDSIRHSVINYLHALRIFENIDICLEMGHTLGILSLLNWRAGKLEKAIQQAKKQIQIAHQLSDHQYEIGAIITTGSYFTKILEFDSVKIYLDKALTLLQKYPDTLMLSEVYLNKGYNALWEHDYSYFSGNIEIPDDDIPESIYRRNMYWLIEQIDIEKEIKESLDDYLKESIYWNSKHIDLEKVFDFKRNVNPPFYISIYYNLAFAHLRLNTPEDTKSGLGYLYIAKNMVDTLANINYMKLFVYRLLGSLKSESGDYRAAIKIYKEGIKKAEEARATFNINNYDNINPFSWTIAEDFYFTQVLSWTYARISYAYAKLGDFKKAHEYYVLQEKARNEIYLEDNKNLIVMLEAESENEKIQNQVSILERDKKINELKLVQTRNLNIIIIVVFVILLLMGIIFIRQNKMKTEHKNVLLEQKLLRLQMNPHFIFNVLSSIHSLMNPKDVNKASDYLGNFSRLLRTSLESSREDYILLDEEINSMKNYLDLQQLRYEKKFNYNIDVDRDIDLESAIIPPMLIQPFIENAIEHGFLHKKEPGNIYIRFKLENKKISCEIEDDGVGREKAWEVEYSKKGRHKSLATEIIRDRIKILNKKLKQKISLAIIDKQTETFQSTGTIVRLNLPYILD